MDYNSEEECFKSWTDVSIAELRNSAASCSKDIMTVPWNRPVAVMCWVGGTRTGTGGRTWKIATRVLKCTIPVSVCTIQTWFCTIQAWFCTIQKLFCTIQHEFAPFGIDLHHSNGAKNGAKRGQNLLVKGGPVASEIVPGVTPCEWLAYP